MGPQTFKALWISIAAGAGFSVITAMIIAAGQMPKWSVATLVLLGAAFFSVTAFGLDWTKTSARFVVINLAILAVMVTIGWVVRPHSKQGKVSFRASLIVDSVDEKYIYFHCQLESTPDSLALTNVRYGMKTPDAFEQEVHPPARTLEPGGRLSISPPPFFLTPRQYNSVLLTLVYFADTGSGPQEFTSSYRFFFEQARAKEGNVIDPENVQQK